METGRFSSWRDLLVTPLVQGGTVALTLALTVLTRRAVPLSLVGSALVAYVYLVLVTLVTLAGLRRFFPIGEGIYYGADGYRHRLYSYLMVTNLCWLTMISLVPPVPSFFSLFCKKTLYGLLGARFGEGIISIGGRIQDPHLVSIGREAMIGDDALLLCHAFTNGERPVLILGRIVIEEGAMVGARSVLMPGVTVGAHATVAAMSLVKRNTRIGAYEIWGGVPARKIGESRSSAALRASG